jgi:RHS repeat-associated protein
LTATTGAEVHGYGYDADGNRVSVDADTFAYDWRDRLLEATVGGAAATGYLWDRVGGLPRLAGEGSTAYVWGAEGLTEEVAGGNPAGFPLADLPGSVRLRTDGTGAVVGTSDFEAFGGVRAQSGVQGSLGWTGELRDAGTGLTYLRSRDYAPGSGRFLQRDAVNPSGPGTQGWNRYAYGNGNPATLTDPTGHDAGYVNWQATFLISLTGSAGSFAIAGAEVSAVMAGEASSVLAIGAFGVTSFGVIAIVIGVILAVAAIEIWCHQFHCAMPSFDVSGWTRCWTRRRSSMPAPSCPSRVTVARSRPPRRSGSTSGRARSAPS